MWRTREDLLDYEEALEMRAKIDEILAGEKSIVGRASQTPANVGHGFVTPITPGTSKVETPASGRSDRTRGSVKPDDNEDLEVDVQLKESMPIQAARGVVKIFDEKIYHVWKSLVVVKNIKLEDGEARRPERERLEPGRLINGLRGLN